MHKDSFGLVFNYSILTRYERVSLKKSHLRDEANMFIDPQNPLQTIYQYIGTVGWPVLLYLAFRAGRKLDGWIVEEKAAHATISETKIAVDTIMTNHLHTLESKVDTLASNEEESLKLLRNIDKGIAIIASKVNGGPLFSA